MSDQQLDAEDHLCGYPNFLTALWQEVDAILYHLNEASMRDDELAHISSIAELNPEMHYRHQHQEVALPPPRLAQLMVRELVNYREDHNPYYQAPHAPFLLHRRNAKSSFWLGWGL